MTIFAKVSNFTVTDVVTVDPEIFVFDPDFTWYDITSHDIPPLIGWISYNNGTFQPPNDGFNNPVTITKDATYVYYNSNTAGETYTFALATSQTAAYLSMAKQYNLSRALELTHTFISSLYTIDTRMNFFVLHMLSVTNLLPNRQAYIEQLFTWADSIIDYFITYIATIMASSDIDAINLATPDFTSFSASNPAITLAGALSVVDTPTDDVLIGTSSVSKNILIGDVTGSTQIIFRTGTGGLIKNLPLATSLNDEDITITASQMLTGILTMTPTSSPKTVTTPTAENVVSAIYDATIGDCIDFCIINASASIALNMSVGDGGTLVGSTEIQPSTSSLWRLQCTNITASSEAYVLYRKN